MAVLLKAWLLLCDEPALEGAQLRQLSFRGGVMFLIQIMHRR